MHGGVLLAGLQEAYDMLLPIMHEYPQVWGGKGEGAEAAMEESLIMGFATLMTHLCTYGSSGKAVVAFSACLGCVHHQVTYASTLCGPQMRRRFFCRSSIP